MDAQGILIIIIAIVTADFLLERSLTYLNRKNTKTYTPGRAKGNL